MRCQQQLFQSWIKETETARSDMDSLEQHITEIVCGKVERSLHIFKEEWGKISDERRCYIDQLADVNSLLKNENNDERREKLQGAAADLKYEVANAVTKLKALEIPIKDLQSIVDKKSDLEGAASAVIKGFSLIQDINAERLKRAEMLLELKDEISIDQAALLVSATLEAGLKAISHNKNVESNLDRTEGIVEIAINLKNANVISKEDFKAVRACVDKVRNPVMHGNFGKVKSAEVQKQIHFVRRFFDQHGI